MPHALGRATMAADPTSDSNDSRCHLLELSHDELGVIFDGLADPLQPIVAVVFSSTCKGLRTPLQVALEVLAEWYASVLVLCRKVGEIYQDDYTETAQLTCALLRDEEELILNNRCLTACNMATLGVVFRTNGLPRLRQLQLFNNDFCDGGVHALCDGLGPGSLPSLMVLDLDNCNIGPAGAEDLAAALRRGALPELAELHLCENKRLGDQGAAALAAPLRKRSSLDRLVMCDCGITDKGVSSLFANLGKDDFKALNKVWLDHNPLTDKSWATLLDAIRGGALPRLDNAYLDCEHVSREAEHAFEEGMSLRTQEWLRKARGDDWEEGGVL